MIKNSMNKQSYSEEFDAPALTELAQMAVRYVSEENHKMIPGNSIPNGTYSDFSCGVWEIFVDAIRLGVKIGNGEDVGDSFFMRQRT